MVEILFEFVSIPRSVMMYPRSFRRGTLKVHFSVFNLTLKSQRLLKVSSRSEMMMPLFLDFIVMSST
jgi:hypothetical protein